MSDDFNSRSTDSMFATIIARLDEQDRANEAFRAESRDFRRALTESLCRCETRVASLEADRNKVYGVAAGAGGVFGWLGGLWR